MVIVLVFSEHINWMHFNNYKTEASVIEDNPLKHQDVFSHTLSGRLCFQVNPGREHFCELYLIDCESFHRDQAYGCHH